MKKWLVFLLFIALIFISFDALAQCSICTKNAQQLGDKPARGLNLSIFFLAFTPIVLIAYLGYRWWKNEKLES